MLEKTFHDPIPETKTNFFRNTCSNDSFQDLFIAFMKNSKKLKKQIKERANLVSRPGVLHGINFTKKTEIVLKK